uniref:tRNA dimethylallyltransferase n=1 Tax=Paulinella chromatophora TaxID=39717 RepID=B1X4L7_PAUCH|nr:tRNA delta-2-isopentenylpyrophosphate (IPP) transferase [Paulinella chromatophora]ACB42886.1 tRNA delta-2-isopentenylpyrophosphate (IPP) transferase [Paulinella chromatophora]
MDIQFTPKFEDRQLPLLVTLMGPTASGKTSLAIDIAKQLNLAVLSVDSRQLYQEMAIGTAKPTPNQLNVVKHELFNLRYPNHPINLQQFQILASAAIRKQHKLRGIAFLVGGSGLYLKALIQGICPPGVPPHLDLRAKLEFLGENRCNYLLSTTDLKSASRISYNDRLRTQRALEVVYATGKPFSTQKGQVSPSWQLLELGLDSINLRERIQKRSIILYKQGLVEETRRLISRYGYELPLLETIGYNEVCRWLKGEITISMALTITIHRTLQFAKRQRTWFYHQHEPIWLNEANPLQHALTVVEHVLG